MLKEKLEVEELLGESSWREFIGIAGGELRVAFRREFQEVLKEVFNEVYDEELNSVD